MHIHINVVTIVGLCCLLIGVGGAPHIFIGGCVLIGSALVAKTILYQRKD